MTVAELTIEARPRLDAVPASPTAWYDPDSATYGDAEGHASTEPVRHDGRVITVPVSRSHEPLHGEWG